MPARKTPAGVKPGAAKPITEEVMKRWTLTKPAPPQCLLTPAVAAGICETVAAGNYIKTAVAAAGVPRKTYDNWVVKAREQPDSVYAEFVDLLEQARAQAEAANVRIITTAAAKTWQAAAWLLERQYPERWGRRDRVFNTVDGDHRVTFVFEEQKTGKGKLEVIKPEEAPLQIESADSDD